MGRKHQLWQKEYDKAESAFDRIQSEFARLEDEEISLKVDIEDYMEQQKALEKEIRDFDRLIENSRIKLKKVRSSINLIDKEYDRLEKDVRKLQNIQPDIDD